ncbi:MAG: excinuclease ABC subunit UvrA [Thermoleophilia bacterium]|nr:excinuclease ABC subunit UvrA [Thermoleophilia bacterium]
MCRVLLSRRQTRSLCPLRCDCNARTDRGRFERPTGDASGHLRPNQPPGGIVARDERQQQQGHGQITIRGARANNLRNVSIDVPKRQLVVFTGVSGSGKSSLVFDTIAAEAQRQLNETFTAFARQRMPHHGKPDVDFIDGLSTAVIVDQKRLGGGPRSTVGTTTDINPVMRLLYSRIGSPAVFPSNLLAFNDAEGMCPRCDGVGVTSEPDPDQLVDRSLSLDDGALLHPTMGVGTWPWRMYARAGFDRRTPVGSWSPEAWQTFLYHDAGPDEFEGLITRFERIYLRRDPNEVSEAYLRSFDRFVARATCPECHGTRLNERARACEVNGRSIADWCQLDVIALREVLQAVREPEAATMVAEIDIRLEQMQGLGLGYLTLDRATSTLSGGESQRIKMVRHLSSSLVDLMYVFDEPTVGLHPADVDQVATLLARLRDRGNSVLVVEHDRDVILAADHVIDVGPGPGRAGGDIVFQGDVDGLIASATPTGAHLARVTRLNRTPRVAHEVLRVEGVTANNLVDVDVDFPMMSLVAVTGVAGSGKSTLVMRGLVEQYAGIVVVDQSPVGTSIRSCPATYTGLMDPLRKAFADAHGVSPALFSFNSRGACVNCDGRGFIETELSFLDPIITQCPVCDGTRYRPEVLEYQLDGLSIADVLALTAREASEQLTVPNVVRRARTVVDVGLGYLALGQPLSTLSGGEAQRIKLASELSGRGSIYVLDEPTTGLHMADVDHLVQLLDRMVTAGNTVIVVEHDLAVVAQADWIIDMGPEGGALGGQVLFEGTPAELIDSGTLTGRYLRQAIDPTATVDVAAAAARS